MTNLKCRRAVEGKFLDLVRILNFSSSKHEAEIACVLLSGCLQHRALHVECIILAEVSSVCVYVIGDSGGVWVSICEEFIVEGNPGLNNICGVLSSWVSVLQGFPIDVEVEVVVVFCVMNA